MKAFLLFLSVIGLSGANFLSQDIKVDFEKGSAIQIQSSITPGTFSNSTYTIHISPSNSANRSLTVGGFANLGGVRRLIAGSITAKGTLRASIKRRAGQTADTPIDGRYDFASDNLIITKVGNSNVQYVLEREGGKVKLGTYSGKSTEGDSEWELTISKSSGTDHTVTGVFVSDGKRSAFKGTMKANGKILAVMVNNEIAKIDGQYDFQNLTVRLELHISGVGASINSELKFGKLPESGEFGLVEKTVGEVPGPAEANDFTISGTISDSHFSIDLIMKPPYQGEAHMKHEYSHQLTPVLKPGQIIELTVISSSSKSGTYQPNLSGTGWWIVEGDGAEVLETKKSFSGTASDGKFYANTEGKTRFKVLKQGTIKIIGAYNGQFWGAGSKNWNPCTYVYKFKAKPTVKVGN